VLLLLAALASPSPAADSTTPSQAADKDPRPRASLTVEGEEPPEASPPFPEGDEKIAIRDSIVGSSAPIRECYEKRLLERPTLQGKLVARFDIGPNGKVIGATAEGIADRELILCVVSAVRRFEFDKPRSGGKLRVAYPFKFEPRPTK